MNSSGCASFGEYGAAWRSGSSTHQPAGVVFRRRTLEESVCLGGTAESVVVRRLTVQETTSAASASDLVPRFAVPTAFPSGGFEWERRALSDDQGFSQLNLKQPGIGNGTGIGTGIGGGGSVWRRQARCVQVSAMELRLGTFSSVGTRSFQSSPGLVKTDFAVRKERRRGISREGQKERKRETVTEPCVEFCLKNKRNSSVSDQWSGCGDSTNSGMDSSVPARSVEMLGRGTTFPSFQRDTVSTALEDEASASSSLSLEDSMKKTSALRRSADRLVDLSESADVWSSHQNLQFDSPKSLFGKSDFSSGPRKPGSGLGGGLSFLRRKTVPSPLARQVDPPRSEYESGGLSSRPAASSFPSGSPSLQTTLPFPPLRVVPKATDSAKEAGSLLRATPSGQPPVPNAKCGEEALRKSSGFVKCKSSEAARGKGIIRRQSKSSQTEASSLAPPLDLPSKLNFLQFAPQRERDLSAALKNSSTKKKGAAPLPQDAKEEVSDATQKPEVGAKRGESLKSRLQRSLGLFRLAKGKGADKERLPRNAGPELRQAVFASRQAETNARAAAEARRETQPEGWEERNPQKAKRESSTKTHGGFRRRASLPFAFFGKLLRSETV